MGQERHLRLARLVVIRSKTTYTHTYFQRPEKRECTGFVGWKLRAVVAATVGSPVGMRLIHVIEVPEKLGEAKKIETPFSIFLLPLLVSYLRKMKYSVEEINEKTDFL